MKEFLLWTLGVQKLASSESALFNGLLNNEIAGSSPADLLGQIIKCPSIEAAETLALTSGGLRTVRALWYCTEILKNIKDDEKLRELAKLEYPYEYLVKKGKELDSMNSTLLDEEASDDLSNGSLKETLIDVDDPIDEDLDDEVEDDIENEEDENDDEDEED